MKIIIKLLIIKTQLSNINKTDSVSIIAFSQGTVIVEIMLALELFGLYQKKFLVSPSGIMDKNIKVNKISNIEILATFIKQHLESVRTL